MLISGWRFRRCRQVLHRGYQATTRQPSKPQQPSQCLVSLPIEHKAALTSQHQASSFPRGLKGRRRSNQARSIIRQGLHPKSPCSTGYEGQHCRPRDSAKGYRSRCREAGESSCGRCLQTIDGQHTRELESNMSKIMYEIQNERSTESDEQTYQRAMRDPEVAEIMADPVM